MCRGMTSAGGQVDEDLAVEVPVAVYAEGKQHAMCIGLTKMSGSAMKATNRGIGVESIHYLRDALWAVQSME
jgi:PUA domain protein